jgi:hypothetical protein
LKYHNYFEKSVCGHRFLVLTRTIGLEVSEISCADHELEDWTHGEEEEEKEDLVISRKRGLHTQAVGRVSLQRSNATAKGPEKIKRAGTFRPFSFST